MLETKEQKQYFFIAISVVVILGLVSFWNRPNFKYQEQQGLKNKALVFDEQAYQKYLASLKIDPQASQKLFEKILSKEDVKKEVEAELKTSQKIVPPELGNLLAVDNKKTGYDAMTDYLARTTGAAMVFNNKAKPTIEALFNPAADEKTIVELQGFNNQSIKDLSAVVVPKEAEKMQKNLLLSYLAFDRMLEASKEYIKNPEVAQWDKVYRDYSVINTGLSEYITELAKATDKYKLAGVNITPYYVKNDEEGNKHFVFIKQANAFLGLGDVSITVGDIPRLIIDAIEQGLVGAFSQFMGSFMDKMLTRLEENYKIANFMYYSDALISGQYVNDYLNKYVSEDLDKQIVKRFIPQFNCGKNDQSLELVFQRKAQDTLGFDPDEVSPNDPDYYQKMAKVGNFLTNPDGSGWSMIYEDMANQAKSEAEKAAEKELVSPGLKTPRDTIKKAINNSVNNIVSAQRAGMQSVMQLGISNAKSFVSGMIATLTQNLITKFVFRGAAVDEKALGVLKEQATCLATAQVSPVVPSTTTEYVDPPPPPNEDDLIEEAEVAQCIRNNDHTYNCVNAVMKFTRRCGIANEPKVCAKIPEYFSENPLENPEN